MKYRPNDPERLRVDRERKAAWRAANPDKAREANRRAYLARCRREGHTIRETRGAGFVQTLATRVLALHARQNGACALCAKPIEVEPATASACARLDAAGVALAHDGCLRRAARGAAVEVKPAEDFPGVPALQARARAAVAAGEACGSCGAVFGASDDPLTLRPLDTWRTPGWRHAGCPRKPSAGP